MDRLETLTRSKSQQTLYFILYREAQSQLDLSSTYFRVERMLVLSMRHM